MAASAFQTFLKILDGISPGGISTVSITAGGSGYSVGDILTVTTGGTGGTLKVLTAPAGVVGSVQLLTSGTNYTTGAGKATTVVPAGGTLCTINILTLGHQIAEILNPSGPNQKVNMVDVTSHDSPNGFSEVIAGVADGGEVSFEANFLNDASQARAIADFQNKTARNFAIVVPLSTPETWSFSGVFSAIDQTGPHDSKLGFTGTIKISGKPTLA